MACRPTPTNRSGVWSRRCCTVTVVQTWHRHLLLVRLVHSRSGNPKVLWRSDFAVPPSRPCETVVLTARLWIVRSVVVPATGG